MCVAFNFFMRADQSCTTLEKAIRCKDVNVFIDKREPGNRDLWKLFVTTQEFRDNTHAQELSSFTAIILATYTRSFCSA